MTTWVIASSARDPSGPAASEPSVPEPRRARFARISAVQQMIGASAFTAESPVIMPTLREPNAATRSKNFSLTSALSGAV